MGEYETSFYNFIFEGEGNKELKNLRRPLKFEIFIIAQILAGILKNILQFLSQILTLFNPISNILATCKFYFILCNMHTSLNIVINRYYAKYVTYNENWNEEIILYEFGKWW